MFGSISVLHVPVIGTMRGVGPSAWDGGGVEGFRGGFYSDWGLRFSSELEQSDGWCDVTDRGYRQEVRRMSGRHLRDAMATE